MTAQELKTDWKKYEFIAYDGRITPLVDVFVSCRNGHYAEELIFEYKNNPGTEISVKIGLDGECYWAGDGWEYIGHFRKIERA